MIIQRHSSHNSPKIVCLYKFGIGTVLLNSKICHRQIAIQLPELTTEYQDNARNTVLAQTLPSSDNAGNAESTSNTNFTNEENNRHDGIKTSNVLINQNITMNISM